MKHYLVILSIMTTVLWAEGEDLDWRKFRTPNGQFIEARVLRTDLNGVFLELKQDKKEIYVPYTKLSQGDQSYVQNWNLNHPDGIAVLKKDEKGAGPEAKPGAAEHPYPRTKADVEKYLQAVKDRRAPAGLDRQIQKAANELNIYRFLTGVSWKVLPDDGLSKSAERASKTFVEQGEKSKETDKLLERFLFVEGEEDMEQVISDFLADSKRDHRGTMPLRARVLHPQVGRTGFGLYEGVVAMRVDKPRSFQGPGLWTYPGRGYFPHERLHGDQWSAYVNYRIPDDPKDPVLVEITRLLTPPKSYYPLDKPVPGEPIRVRDVAVHDNAVHFRPAKPAKDGMYWVRITGQGLEVQYIVDFYE